MSSPCCKPTKGCPDPEQPKYDYFYGRDGYEQPSQDSCCAVEQPRGQCCGGFNGAPLSSAVVGRPLCNACPGDVDSATTDSMKPATEYRQEEMSNGVANNNLEGVYGESLVQSYSQASFEDENSDQMSAHVEQMYRQCGSCGSAPVAAAPGASTSEYNQNELVGDGSNGSGSPNVNVGSSDLQQQPQYNTENQGPTHRQYVSGISGNGLFDGLFQRFNHPLLWAFIVLLVLAGGAYGLYYWYKHGGKKMLSS